MWYNRRVTRNSTFESTMATFGAMLDDAQTYMGAGQYARAEAVLRYARRLLRLFASMHLEAPLEPQEDALADSVAEKGIGPYTLPRVKPMCRRIRQSLQLIELNILRVREERDRRRLEDAPLADNARAATDFAKLLQHGDIGTGGFDSLFGAEALKEDMNHKFIYPMKRPMLYGSAASRGVLLYGMPGTGKTMVARATVEAINRHITIVHQTDASAVRRFQLMFFSGSAAQLKDSRHGQTEKNIEQLFHGMELLALQRQKEFEMGEHKPFVVLFLDEVDALAQNRARSTNTSVLNTVLRETSRVERSKHMNLTIIAATNEPENVDSAFLRRLDYQVRVRLPNKTSLAHILAGELKKELLRRGWTSDKPIFNIDAGVGVWTVEAILKVCERFAHALFKRKASASHVASLCRLYHTNLYTRIVEDDYMLGEYIFSKKMLKQEVDQIQPMPPPGTNNAYSGMLQRLDKYDEDN